MQENYTLNFARNTKRRLAKAKREARAALRSLDYDQARARLSEVRYLSRVLVARAPQYA